MTIIDEFYLLVELAKAHIAFALLCVSVLWVVHFFNWLLHYRLLAFGIHPRKWWSLPFIFSAPFLHANFDHLFLNSVPAIILIDLVSIYGNELFFNLTIFIILVGGFAVWLVGRNAIHVGASAVMMGYWGFLIIASFQQGTAMTIILALICLYYLGGMAINLLPVGKEASWEGHLLGCLAGMAYPYVLPYVSMLK